MISTGLPGLMLLDFTWTKFVSTATPVLFFINYINQAMAQINGIFIRLITWFILKKKSEIGTLNELVKKNINKNKRYEF